MQKCPDCGYQLEPFQTGCPRCKKFGKPQPPAPPPSTPQPEPVTPPSQARIAGNAIAAAFGSALLFAFPALLWSIFSGGLIAMWQSTQPIVFPNTPVDPPTLCVGIILLVSISLGAYFIGGEPEGPWGGLTGLAAGVAWICGIYATTVIWNIGGASKGIKGIEFVICLLGGCLLVALAAVAGAYRLERGLGGPKFKTMEVGAGFLTALMPCLAFVVVPYLQEREEGQASAAMVGSALGVCLWAFRLLHG